MRRLCLQQSSISLGIQLMLVSESVEKKKKYERLFQTAMPIRVMKLCGIEAVIVTNAAGALNPRFGVGDIMMIKGPISVENILE